MEIWLNIAIGVLACAAGVAVTVIMQRRMAATRHSLEPRHTLDAGPLMDMWVQAIIYDLISFDPVARQYQIKSRALGGRALRGWLVDMGASRTDAFRFFEDNIDALKPEIDAALKEKDVPGPDNAIRLGRDAAIKACRDNTYLQTISKCPIPLADIEHYPAEADLLEKEIVYILDHV